MMINSEKFRKLLEAEKASLENDLKQVGRENPERPGEWEVTPIGETDVEFREDVADQMEEMDGREEIELNLEQRYDNIARALEKIAKGTYGICEINWEPIEEDRLEANPAAR